MALTEITRTGLGGRLGNSFKQVVVGFVMFLVSFGVLYYNEGRTDMSIVARTATVLKTESAADASASGKLVAVEGKITTTESVSDMFVFSSPARGEITLEQSNVLALQRNVEYYAWVEEKNTKTTKNAGGSETTETTYNYKNEWVTKVPNSAEFKQADTHVNPQIASDQNATARVASAALGAYTFDVNTIELPASEKLAVNKELFKQLPTNARVEGSDYVFIGTGTMATPVVGDMRVSYGVVPTGKDVAVFGKLDGSKLTAFVDAKNNTLYRIFNGTKDTAVATLHGEYSMALWVFRLIGFLLMWVGLASLFSPFSTFLDIIPIAGSFSRGLVAAATFVIALVLSLVTIIVSAILHSVIAMVIAAVVILGIAVAVMKMRGKKKLAV